MVQITSVLPKSILDLLRTEELEITAMLNPRGDREGSDDLVEE